jgi:hypothetical protein
VAVALSVPHVVDPGELTRPVELNHLAVFRCSFYDSLTARADALFELTDGAPRGAGVRMEVRDRPSLSLS